uniref:L-threonylcarbamoyladenylate synthase n=1 Tax=Candidatus Electronema sp. TaxID=2698783 RepID=UPI004055F5D0
MARQTEINPVNPQQRLISMAAEILKKGGVVCYPTDTMYGLGCDIFNQKAVKRVHEIKQRDKDKPFSFMCASLADISQYAHVSSPAYRLLKKHLPGPYTMVLPGSKLVPKIMLTKQKTVGIRLPQSPICLALIEMLGNPVLNTSALREGCAAPADSYAVEELFGGQVDLIIDGGQLFPEPSTVISLVTDQPEILRAGKGDTAPFLERE